MLMLIAMGMFTLPAKIDRANLSPLPLCMSTNLLIYLMKIH